MINFNFLIQSLYKKSDKSLILVQAMAQVKINLIQEIKATNSNPFKTMINSIYIMVVR